MPTSGSCHLGSHAQAANSDERDADVQTSLLNKYTFQPATVSQRAALLFQDWWLWEIASALIAVLAITVIIVILVVFDQDSLPDWPALFTVRLIPNLESSLLLKRCIDKLSHLILCHNSEAFHHVRCWGIDIAVEMVVVSSG